MGPPVAAFLLVAAAPGCDDGGGADGSGGSGNTANGAGGKDGTGGLASSGAGGKGGGADLPATLSCAAPEGTAPALMLLQIASGFDHPIQVKTAPGDDERLYVVEQTGKIWIVQDGQVSAEPFLDIQQLVANPEAPIGEHAEQGLLGLAFHPKYAENGRFFVHYSEGPFTEQNPKGNSYIAEYQRSDDPDKALSDAGKLILKQNQPYTNHNGGALEFSPKDGFLYIAFGDGGADGDPQNNGQTTNTWLGKILRIDVDAGAPYAVPQGNMPGGKPEIWDMGLRNPWRFSFDACTGDLYIGDVGQNGYEEVDVEPAGQGHKNYGWNTMEGSHCYPEQVDCNEAGMTLPVTDYDHATGQSVTGGYVYRSSRMPGLRGSYFYADGVTNRVWTLRWDGGATATPTEITADLSPPEGIVSFGQDNVGQVYLVSLHGEIYRIEPR